MMPAILLNNKEESLRGMEGPLALFDDKLNLVTANEEFIFLIGKAFIDELKLEDALSAVNPEYLFNWKNEYEAFIAKQTQNVFHVYEKKDSTSFFRMSWLIDASGEDVVEVRIVEPSQNDLSIEEERKQGINSLSHEVNTPLNGILGIASLIADEFPEEPALQNYARILRSKGKEIQTTMGALLDLYKNLGQGEVSLPETVNMEALLKEVLLEYDELMHEYEMKVKVDLNKSSTSIVTQGLFLQKALNHILNYIVKHSGGSSIHLSGKKEGTAYKILLSVSGISLRFNSIIRLFKNSKRVNTDITDLQNAANMNLNLAKGFLRRVGGELDIAYSKGVKLSFLITLKIK